MCNVRELVGASGEEISLGLKCSTLKFSTTSRLLPPFSWLQSRDRTCSNPSFTLLRVPLDIKLIGNDHGDTYKLQARPPQQLSEAVPVWRSG